MMTKLRPNYAIAAAIVICTDLFVGTLHAQLLMTLSGQPSSSVVTATFSGSTTATTGSGSVYAIGWEFDPVSFDPFPATITGGDFGLFLFTSGSASITIGGVSHSMDGVFLQDSSDSPVLGLERFGTTGFTYDLAAGQTFDSKSLSR